MFIQNVSYHEVKYGTHRHADVLIQIVDPGLDFPVPSNDRIFKEIHKFEFSDVERETDVAWEHRMTEQQAQEIAKILTAALANEYDVIVHCVAGLCRSGAVTEVGVMMGFEDTGIYRQPNVHVKTSLMRALGMIPDYYE
jgi:predicted protein tyrosine phosphatase